MLQLVKDKQDTEWRIVQEVYKREESAQCFRGNTKSAIKRNETELFVVRWMDLQSVIQSEVSQKEKNKYSMLTHIYGI